MAWLIPADMNELWVRLFISLNFLGFSLYARTIAARRKDAEVQKNGGTAARVRRAALYQVEEPGWILKPGFQGKKD